MPAPQLTLYVCSACNLACQECIMQHHMAFDPRYQMPVAEITDFLAIAEANNYKFDVTLSGGEPLLWQHLNTAIPLLRASPSVLSLQMFTNAVPHAKLTDEVAAMFNHIRISDYGHNAAAMKEVQARWPKNVHAVPRYGFWRNPRRPVDRKVAHPVECLNPEIMLYDRRIYACPHSLSISRVLAVPPPADSLSVPLAAGFMAQLPQLKRTYHAELCTRCISNAKVRNAIGKADINVSKSKQPELHQIGNLRKAAATGWGQEERMQSYSVDWTTPHAPQWRTALSKFVGKPNVQALEIGTYEGRSAVWFLKEILTGEGSQLTCVDSWLSEVFQAGIAEAKWDANTAPFAPRVHKVKSKSVPFLLQAAAEGRRYDFMYVDGDHRGDACLTDMILAWQLLNVDGVMIVDDTGEAYSQHLRRDRKYAATPRDACNAFLRCFVGRCKLLHNAGQVIVQKLAVPELALM